MKIALVDDDSDQIAGLAEMLLKELAAAGCPDCRIDSFDSGEAFLAEWQTGLYDMIILDIFMNRLTGVETARRIRALDEEVSLVFCSTSNEFASESYELNAQYYLHKPVTRTDLSAMFRRLNPKRLDLVKSVVLPDGHPVMLRQILYTDYSNHVVTLYMKDDAPYQLRASQSQMEALLLPYGYFFSPIKGMIINFYETVKLTEDTFVMSCGKTIPVTRRKYKEAKEAYNHFRFEKMRKEVEADALL